MAEQQNKTASTQPKTSSTQSEKNNTAELAGKATKISSWRPGTAEILEQNERLCQLRS